MATLIWRGDAPAVAQVDNVTFSGWTSGDVFTVTINGKAINYTTVDTNSATVVDAFVSLIGQYDNDIPEFAEISASDGGSTLILTGPTDGKPFTTTWTDDGAGSASSTTPTSPSGPNWANEPDNWSTGSNPANSDDVYFENNSVDCLYGLDQLSAVTLTSLNIKASYTGKIGLENYNSNLSYYEYRPTELAISATNVYVGEGDGAGSGRIKLNLGSAQSEVRVYRTATPDEPELGSLILRGTNTSNVLRVTRGNVGVGTNKAGDDADFATVQVSFEDSQDSDASVRIGESVSTLTTVNQDGGELYIECDFGTLIQNGGESWILKAASPSTVDVLEGVCNYKSTGTLSQGYASADGSIVFDRVGTRTVTNMSVYAGATLRDPGDTVTWSNAINLVRCSIPEVTLDFGVDGTVLPT